MAIKNSAGQIYTEELGGILLAKSIDDRTEIKSVCQETSKERAIELGYGYLLSYNSTIATSSSDDILIATGDKLVTLTLPRIMSYDASEVAITIGSVTVYEDATITDAGGTTNLYFINYNRNATYSEEVVVTESPTVSDYGDIIYKTYFTESILDDKLTLQLKANTNYIINVANFTSISITASVNSTLFELQD